jgi:hypothetical protein
MAFNYSPKIVTDGLVLYLDAANRYSYPGSGTTWSDISRGGNNGTLVNGPTFSTDGGGSIITDGIDDGIFINTFPNIPVKNSSFTVVFDDDIQSGDRRLFAQDSINVILWTKDVNNQYFRINNITQPTLPFPVQPPGVKYLTLTIDDNYLVKFYNRGNLITEQSFAGGAINYLWNSGFGAANLGYWTAGPSQFSKYKYYQLTLYSKTLSPSEILQNYNATKTRFGL